MFGVGFPLALFLKGLGNILNQNQEFLENHLTKELKETKELKNLLAETRSQIVNLKADLEESLNEVPKSKPF